jgi:hypothetical protein
LKISKIKITGKCIRAPSLTYPVYSKTLAKFYTACGKGFRCRGGVEIPQSGEWFILQVTIFPLYKSNKKPDGSILMLAPLFFYMAIKL